MRDLPGAGPPPGSSRSNYGAAHRADARPHPARGTGCRAPLRHDALVDDHDLIEAAAAARGRAHVPYSRFAMGAAVLTDTGEVRVGSVVENVSLGLAMCAERVALFATVATGAGRPTALALVAPRTAGELTHPCGACLQVALELGGPALRVVVADPDGASTTSDVGTLLPLGPAKRTR